VKDDRHIEELFKKALEHEHLGEFERALSLIDRTLKLKPGFAEGLFVKALLLKKKGGRFERALELLKKAKDLYIEKWKQADCLLEMANILLLMGQAEKSVAVYGDAISLYAGFNMEKVRECYCYQAKGHEKLGAMGEALSCLERSFGFYQRDGLPGLVAYYTDRMRLAEKAGFYDDMLDAFEKLMALDPEMLLHALPYRDPSSQTRENGFEKVMMGLNRLLREDPERSSARLLMGALFHRMERPDESIACLERALDLEPEDDFARRLVAKSLMRSGEYAKALDCLKKLKVRGMETPGFLSDLATCYELEGQPEKALQTYRRIPLLQPDALWAYETIAALCESLGRKQEALDAYATLRERDPDGFSHPDRLGALSLELGRWEDALRHLNAALASGKEDGGKEDPNLYLLRGKAYESLDRQRKAVTDYDRVLEACCADEWPLLEEALLAKANLVIRSFGEYERGLGLVKEILDRDPEHEAAIILKGDALKGLKKFPDAVKCYVEVADKKLCDALLGEGFKLFSERRYDLALQKYVEAFRRFPKNWEIFYCAASAYAHLGQLESAVKYLEVAFLTHKQAVTVYERDPDFDGVRSIPEFVTLLEKVSGA
jgi:tetratricopeptide (TPR) repeat protein